MKVRIQLVENNPLQRVPSVFFNIYKTQYIFNVIPTLLRHRKKQKINLYNSSNIFFTKNNIEAFGGLPNYLLFRSGSEHSDKIVANKLTLYGDEQLIKYFDQMRFKLGYKSLRFSYSAWDQSKYKLGVQNLGLFQKIKTDPELPNYFSTINSYLTSNCQKREYFDSRMNLSTMKTRYINIPCHYFHNNLIDIYPLTTTIEGTVYTHYLCIFPNQRKGKQINIQKFVAQTKITKPNKIKDLQLKGQIEEEGKIYKKSDYVYKQDFKPSNILIFHYKNEQSVEAILNHELFQNYIQNKNKTNIIIHIVQDEKLLEADIFKTFLGKFQTETYHYWYHSNIVNLKQNQQQKFVEDNVASMKIWREIFPEHIPNIVQERIKSYKGNFQQLITSLFPGLHHLFHQRVHNFVKNQYEGHRFEQKREARAKISVSDVLRKTLSQYNNQITQVTKILAKVSLVPKLPKVIILGTSSSIPTMNRNISGILLTFQKCSILMDCGEETLEQLYNHFPAKEIEQQLLRIKVIFISHIHSDHNLGILNLISERKRIAKLRGVNEKVYLVLPFNVYHWYVTYLEIIEDLSSTCEVLFTQTIVHDSQLQEKEKSRVRLNRGHLSKRSLYKTELEDKIFTELQTSAKTKELVAKQMPNQQNRLEQFFSFLKENDFEEFSPVKAMHCPQSFGLVIKYKTYKISYSGDTRPSQSFKQAAKNSDIMIHEATFNDVWSKKAELSNHSTLSQAVKIGLESNAGHLVLTHFSNDFSLPLELQDKKELQDYFNKNTIFSYDHLQVPLENPNAMVSLSKLISRVNESVEKYNYADDDFLN